MYKFEDDSLLGYCAVQYRKTYRRFWDAYWLIALLMEAVSTYETSANTYQTTRRNIPERQCHGSGG